MKKERVIELGSKVRCVVTGFTGIATAHSRHLHLCDRYTVQPPTDADGKLKEAYCIDGHSLEVLAPPSDEIKKSIESMVEVNREKTTAAPKVGGPATKAKRI